MQGRLMCSSDIPPASDPRLLILSLATPYPRRGNCLPQALVLVVPQPTQPFPQDSFLFLSGVSVHYRPQGCCPSLTPSQPQDPRPLRKGPARLTAFALLSVSWNMPGPRLLRPTATPCQAPCHGLPALLT